MGLMENGEKAPLQQMLVDNSQNEGHLKSLIFGPYYRLFQAALVVPHDAERENSARGKICKYFGVLFLIAGLVPLFYRAFKLIGGLNQTTLLSMNWAFNFMFFIQQLHSIIALITLFVLFKTNFFNEFTRKFLVAIKNKIPEGVPYLKSHIFLGLFACFFMYTYVFFCFENINDYDMYVIDRPNSTAVFRKSIFGDMNMFILDSVVIVWTGLVSVLAIVAYNLVATSIASEYQRFNEELKEASKNGQLAHVDLLNTYGSRQLEFMDLAHFAFSKFGGLVTFTLIAGIITHCMAGFAMRGFAEELPGFAKISVISYMILGILMLLADVKRASDFAHSIDETKNILLFERSIHTSLDEKLIQIANNVVFRISHSHYLPVAFSSFKINEKFFQRAFLIFPFLIEFLNAYKVHME